MLSTGKRHLGRPWCRWEDYIRIDLNNVINKLRTMCKGWILDPVRTTQYKIESEKLFSSKAMRPLGRHGTDERYGTDGIFSGGARTMAARHGRTDGRAAQHFIYISS